MRAVGEIALEVDDGDERTTLWAGRDVSDQFTEDDFNSTMEMHPDGNLLLYDSNQTAAGRYRWSTYTSVPGSVMRVNDDNSFGVYDGSNGTCYWTSASELSRGFSFRAPYRFTSAQQKYEVVIQGDGNLVINDITRLQPVTVWATETQLQNATLPVYLAMSWDLLLRTSIVIAHCAVLSSVHDGPVLRKTTFLSSVSQRQTVSGSGVEIQQKRAKTSTVQHRLWKSDTVDTGNYTYAQIQDNGQLCVFPKTKPQAALPLVKPPAELCFGPTFAAYTADAGDKSKYSLQLYTQLSNYSIAAFNKSAFELAVVDAVYTLRSSGDAAAVAVTVTDSSVVAVSARRLLAHDSKSSTTSIHAQQQQAHRATQAAAPAADASDAVLLLSYNVRNIRGAAAAAAVLTQLQSSTGSTALRYSFSNRTNFTGVTTLGVSTTPQNIKVPFSQQRDSSTSTGVIVGSVIGVLIVAAAAAGCVMYRRLRKHRRATTVSAKLSPQRKLSLSSMASMKDSSRAPRHTVADSSSSSYKLNGGASNSVQSSDTSSSSYKRTSSSVLVPRHPDDSSSAAVDDIEQQRAVKNSEHAPLSATDTTDSSSTAGTDSRPQQRAAAASMRTAIMTRFKPKAEPAAALANTTKSTGTTAAAAALTSSSGNSAAVNAASPKGASSGAVVATTKPALAGRFGYTHRASVLVGNMSAGLTSAAQRGVDKHGAKAELLWEGI
eukprot:8308-Heterococcus_DN1.PRE.1